MHSLHDLLKFFGGDEVVVALYGFLYDLFMGFHRDYHDCNENGRYIEIGR